MHFVFRCSRLLFAVLVFLVVAACIPDPLDPVRPQGGLSSRELFISEVMPANKSSVRDFQGDFPDWIEIYNPGSSPVNLEGWYLTDSGSDPRRWAFPRMEIAAGSWMVVFASGKDYHDPAFELHANFSLSSAKDEVYLVKDQVMVDQVNFDASPDNQAWIRTGDSSLELTDQPSPGQENIAGIPEVGFSREPGIYSGITLPDGLDLMLSGSGTIHYTLDGSLPLETSPVWDGSPIHVPLPALDALPQGLVVSARIWKDGTPGPLKRGTFILHRGELDTDRQIGIFCLSGDPRQLMVESPSADLNGNGDPWDDADPALAGDSLFNTTHLFDDTEYVAHVEFFDARRARVVNQDAGISLSGAYSRNFAFKSLALHARSKYGKSRFDHDFFGLRNSAGGPIRDYDALVLRSSGNDWNSTMMRDVLMTGLLEGTGVDHQAALPVAVYINGKYYGFCFLREKINEDFIWSHHPETTGKALDILANYGETISGSDAGFWSMYNWVASADLSVNANWNTLSNLVDVDNFMDYHLANIFFCNTDWPANNDKYWRTSDGGKWRWICFDTDFGFSLIGNANDNTFAWLLDTSNPTWGNSEVSTLLFRKFMTNPGFKSRLLARMETLLGSNFSTDRVLARIDGLVEVMSDEISHRHLKRWEPHTYTWLARPVSREAMTQAWADQVEVLRVFARQRPGVLRFFMNGWGNPPSPTRSNGTGLNVSYWTGYPAWTDSPTVTGTDSLPGFSYSQGTSPAGPVNADSWIAEWTGRLSPSWEGAVQLLVKADEDAWLWLDLNRDGDFDDAGEQIIADSSEWWTSGGMDGGFVTLSLGIEYPIRIRYRQNGGTASLGLYWNRGMYQELIPLTQLKS